MKAGALKHWALLAGGAYRKLEREMIDSASTADLVTVTSRAASANLAAMFDYHGRSDLGRKIAVVPYPVDDDFRSGNVPAASERADRVIAIGRWNDPQKDASLLSAGIAWAASLRPRTEFLLIGRDGNAAFGGLCKRIPRVQCLGIQPPKVIATLLRESRSLVLSSRWESGPIAAFEALSSGASVVGPAWVPACEWFSGEGPYCTIFRRRSGAALGWAIVQELTAWDAGNRDPVRAAAYWQPHFDPENVCAALLPQTVNATRE
jgi:hypothetical protein